MDTMALAMRESDWKQMNDNPSWWLWAAAAVALYLGVLQPAIKNLRKRISPAYAAKCLVADHKRDQGRLNRWRQSRERRNRSAFAWAEAHPDDPTAKELLATRTTTSAPASGTVDVGATLRDHYRLTDDMTERVESLKRQQAEWLEWALTNPAEPDAQRLLNERLIEARTKRDNLDSRIESRTSLAEVQDIAVQDDAQLVELQSERAEIAELIRRIEAALESVSHPE